ncbi:MAG: sodium-dependent bicarbonate transport family permease [Trueperaceae bacterium]|nr:sodium-dependent bicarbonate transport family permease [Trueperaceae bacterium]
MATLELVRLNLLSPMVLAFALGIVATRVRSDLRLPDAAYATLSIYLLLAIGLKGGVALRATPLGELLLPVAATLAAGVAIPLVGYALARRVGRWGVADAAALAAHYGSVSVVTFVAAQAFLDRAGVGYEGFLPTLLAILEVPAILVALVIARRAQAQGAEGTPWGATLREVFTGRSILLILGGLAIGAASGDAGLARVDAFFVAPFEGALTLFLLEMGLVTARRFDDVARAGPFLVAYGLGAPLVHGTLGVALGLAVGLSVGGATLFATLLASASYIAATAAVRLALPEANPGRYLTASLAVTFPFNLVAGIPTYARLAAAWGGGAS